MSEEAFRQQLEATRAEYRSDLPVKLARIESLWSEIAGGGSKPAGLAELVRELHTIAGSARTLGVAGVSEAAAAAELYLDPISRKHKPPTARQLAGFTPLLEALRQAAGPGAA